MHKPLHTLSRSPNQEYQGKHRYEHWLVDNQVYFITARCRDRYAAFASESAKLVFWDRFHSYTNQFGYTPWVTSLLDNHYHTLGYLRSGKNLPRMMQRLHGSVAKLVNDLLPQRHRDFWRDVKGQEYFDGCIRNQRQARLAFRYTLQQSVRHGIVTDSQNYSHTIVNVELELAIKRALELQAFLPGVRYKRYAGGDSHAR